MNFIKMEHQNFGLKEAEYEKLVADLKNGDEKMFEHIFLSHFDKALGFLMNNLKISQDKAYDACMDTIIIFRKGLINNKYVYGNLAYLFTRMATQQYLKSRPKEHSVDISSYASSLVDEPTELHEDELEVLNIAWSKLGANCKKVLRLFYYDKVQLKKLAEYTGQNPAAVRKQKERCLSSLKLNLQRYI